MYFFFRTNVFDVGKCISLLSIIMFILGEIRRGFSVAVVRSQGLCLPEVAISDTDVFLGKGAEEKKRIS